MPIFLADGPRARARGAIASLRRQASRPTVGLAILGLLALLARWPFMVSRATVATPLDAASYFDFADAIARGHLWTGGVIPRGPGYPLFVLLTDPLPGPRQFDLAIAQHLLGVALVLATFYWGRRWFGPLTGWLSGLLLATSPLLFSIEDDPLPDLLFGVLVCAVAVVLALLATRSDREPRRRELVLLGVLVAFAALTKPVGYALLASPFLLAVIARWPWRAAARRIATTTAVSAVMLAPWLVGPLTGSGSLPFRQGGLTLFNRLFEVDGRPVPASSRHGRLIRDIQLQLDAAPTGERLHVAALTALEQHFAITDAQAEALMRSLAREAIEADPIGYATRTIVDTKRFLADAHTTALQADGYLPRAGSSAVGLPRTIWRRGADLATTWWILTLNGFSALLVLLLGSRAQRRGTAALLSAWLPIALATMMTHGGLPRYSASLLPLTYLASVAGAVLAARVIAAAVSVGPRERRPAQPTGTQPGRRDPPAS